MYSSMLVSKHPERITRMLPCSRASQQPDCLWCHSKQSRCYHLEMHTCWLCCQLELQPCAYSSSLSSTGEECSVLLRDADEKGQERAASYYDHTPPRRPDSTTPNSRDTAARPPLPSTQRQAVSSPLAFRCRLTAFLPGTILLSLFSVVCGRNFIGPGPGTCTQCDEEISTRDRTASEIQHRRTGWPSHAELWTK